MVREQLAPLLPSTTRQLALPLEPVAEPPVLVGLGLCLPPRKVWPRLTPAAQAAVRQALLRISQEVAHDATARF